MSAAKTSFSRRKFLGAALTGGLASGCGYSAAKPALLPRLAELTATPRPPGEAPASTAAAPPTFIADIHCHTFNARDLPIDGFIRSLAQGLGMPSFADDLLADVTGPFHRALVAATPVDPDVD